MISHHSIDFQTYGFDIGRVRFSDRGIQASCPELCGMWVFSVRLGIRSYIRPEPRGIHTHPVKKIKILNIIRLIKEIPNLETSKMCAQWRY